MSFDSNKPRSNEIVSNAPVVRWRAQFTTSQIHKIVHAQSIRRILLKDRKSFGSFSRFQLAPPRVLDWRFCNGSSTGEPRYFYFVPTIYALAVQAFSEIEFKVRERFPHYDDYSVIKGPRLGEASIEWKNPDQHNVAALYFNDQLRDFFDTYNTKWQYRILSQELLLNDFLKGAHLLKKDHIGCKIEVNSSDTVVVLVNQNEISAELMSNYENAYEQGIVLQSDVHHLGQIAPQDFWGLFQEFSDPELAILNRDLILEKPSEAAMELLSCIQEESFDEQKAREILKKGVDLETIFDDERTLLLAAIHADTAKLSEDNIELSSRTEFLLRLSANPNNTGYLEETPLICAVDRMSPKILQLLLNHGANVADFNSSYWADFDYRNRPPSWEQCSSPFIRASGNEEVDRMYEIEKILKRHSVSPYDKGYVKKESVK